jgi:hypothetical protein
MNTYVNNSYVNLNVFQFNHLSYILILCRDICCDFVLNVSGAAILETLQVENDTNYFFLLFYRVLTFEIFLWRSTVLIYGSLALVVVFGVVIENHCSAVAVGCMSSWISDA